MKKRVFGLIMVAALVGGLPATTNVAAQTTLAYSTFLGGHDFDSGEDVGVDDAGNIVVVSFTESQHFPVTNDAFQRKVGGGFDAAVSKLDPSGTQKGKHQLLWGTFLGGSGFDVPSAVAVDAAGAVYVTGETASSDFPTTPGAFDTTHNGGFDVFVTKFDPNGELVYSTFLGSSASETNGGIAVDATGAAYVTGGARGDDFPTTPGAFDTTHNGDLDGFVAKLDPSGSELAYSTFLGGTELDSIRDVAIDATGAAYVGGETRSADFPVTAGAMDTTLDGGSDGMLAKLSPGGDTLVYSTFLGGSSFDQVQGLRVDPSGAALVAGRTLSDDFPTTPGAFDTTFNGAADAFVAKLTPGGDALDFGTFLGGADEDQASGGIALTGGSVVVAGSTASPDFPVTPGAFDTTFDAGDAFVTTLDATGSSLVDSTFLGGTRGDGARGLALGGDGAIHVTGATLSDDFPITPGAFDTRYNSKVALEGDTFATKLGP